MSAQDIIENEVREIVRRQALDPINEHGAVRRIVSDVMTRYDERSLVVTLPALDNPDGHLLRGLQRHRRVRPPAALPRRSVDRGDLDQRALPGLHRAQRPQRTHHHRAHRGRGPRPGRADAQDHRPPDRLLHPVRRRDAPRWIPPARRHPRHHPHPLGRQHPQVRRPRDLPRRPRRLRNPDVAGGAVPRGVCRLGPERSRRRRHPGRQDDPAQLPRLVDPGERAGRQLRRGVRAQDPAARLGIHADPAGQPRGHRRDPAPAPRQGSAADAPVPDHRRRGPCRGMSRPPDRAQLGPPAHCQGTMAT